MFKSIYQRIITKLARNGNYTTYEAQKLLLLTFAYFCAIGAYTILRSLKTSIFLGMVGIEYYQLAKIIGPLLVIPTMFLYAKLVDVLKRHQVVYACFMFYGAFSFISVLYLYHPAYGIANTVTSGTRWFGWAFEIIMDLFQALIVGSLWSFITSISTTTFATKHYGSITAWSRLSGFLSAIIGAILLQYSGIPSNLSIPLLSGISGALLFIAVGCVAEIVRVVPTSELEGYEAHAHHKAQKGHRPGLMEGLRLLFTQPYVMGIFLLVFGFEIINAIFEYQMNVIISLETGNRIKDMTFYMLMYGAVWQAVGFFVAFFGTSNLLQTIGTRLCLLIPPSLIACLVIMVAVSPNIWTVCIAVVLFRAINYGFSHPIQQMLFVPTVKDIQFKSKSWIESIGRTISKTSGQAVNKLFSNATNPFVSLVATSAVSLAVAFMWLIAALLVGRTYARTVKNGELIGQD